MLFSFDKDRPRPLRRHAAFGTILLLGLVHTARFEPSGESDPQSWNLSAQPNLPTLNWAATPPAPQNRFKARSLDMSYAEVLALMEKRMGQRESAEAIRSTAAQIVRLCYLLGFQPSFILAIIEHESSFKAGVVSSAGAIGLMQLLPATARIVGQNLGIEVPRGGANLKDPVINVTLGMHYLAQLQDDFKTLASTLAAYNLGPARWQQYLQQPGSTRPKSVARYVALIEKTTRLIRDAGHLAWENQSAKNRLALNETDRTTIRR
ncbi:hypothetical protein EBZ37_09500 [bacterium]|nr:hypothetical protein [bacterium]